MPPLSCHQGAGRSMGEDPGHCMHWLSSGPLQGIWTWGRKAFTGRTLGFHCPCPVCRTHSQRLGTHRWGTGPGLAGDHSLTVGSDTLLKGGGPGRTQRPPPPHPPACRPQAWSAAALIVPVLAIMNSTDSTFLPKPVAPNLPRGHHGSKPAKGPLWQELEARS